MQAKKWEWREGKVDPDSPHIGIIYGEWSESALLVARVAKPVGNIFVVEFLQIPQLNESEYQRMKLAVTKELNFFLVELGEKHPWHYAIYHCGTASNMYGDVHWGYFPDGAE